MPRKQQQGMTDAEKVDGWERHLSGDGYGLADLTVDDLLLVVRVRREREEAERKRELDEAKDLLAKNGFWAIPAPDPLAVQEAFYGDCDDCNLRGWLYFKGDHRGGRKLVCLDRTECNRRSPG